MEKAQQRKQNRRERRITQAQARAKNTPEKRAHQRTSVQLQAQRALLLVLLQRSGGSMHVLNDEMVAADRDYDLVSEKDDGLPEGATVRLVKKGSAEASA